MALPWIWFAALAAYGAFTFWYMNTKGALSPAEVDAFLEKFRSIEGMTPETLKAGREFLEADDGGEFVMVNLNQYREKPEYADGREVEGTAEEIETRYTSKMVPRLLASASHPLVAVEPIIHLGGTGEAERYEWDRATMVRYRSRRDFIDIVLKSDFHEDVDHKMAALLRSHSFPSTPQISFVTMRLVPFLLLGSLGLLLDRIFARPR